MLKRADTQLCSCVPPPPSSFLPSFLLIFTHCSAFSTSSPVPPSPLPCSSLFVHPPFFVSSILRLTSYHPPSSSSCLLTPSPTPPFACLRSEPHNWTVDVWLGEVEGRSFVLEETWIQSFQLSLNTNLFFILTWKKIELSLKIIQWRRLWCMLWIYNSPAYI